jgi:hypothetical protein
MMRTRNSQLPLKASWHPRLYASVLTAGLCIGVAACNDIRTEPADMVDAGSWYVTGFRWPHDGKPYESANFLVYSDAASEQARQMLAEIGEEVLADLKGQFGATSPELFVFPPGQHKIHIYTYKNHFPTQWGGWAYYGGLLIYSLDHKERGQEGHTALDMYVPVVQHEVMHVIESLLKASNNPDLVDVWLTEGLGEYVSGGTAGGSITSQAKLAEVIATYGKLNPIAMHQYRYPDTDGVVYNYYYPMFELAVTYLFDADGRGATLEDLRDLLLDVRDGVVFSAAFENRFGISLAQYEEQFFDLMTEYLN